MVLGVIGNCEQFEVLKTVVRPDAVSVVNVFACFEIAAKVSSHDHAMLKFVGISDPDCHVPIRAYKSSGVLHRSTALHRAEPTSPTNALRLDSEDHPAPLACDLNWHSDLHIC
jgi:hypothetical protein